MGRYWPYIIIGAGLLALTVFFANQSSMDDSPMRLDKVPSQTAIPAPIHEHPLSRGTLEGHVLDSAVYRFEEQLLTANSMKKDLKPVYEVYLEKLGVELIVNRVEKTFPHCHNVLHTLGMLIQDRTNSLQDSFALCQDGCSYACLHGVLKAYFSSKRFRERDSLGEVRLTVTPASETFHRLSHEVVDLCREDSVSIKDFSRGRKGIIL